MDVTRGRRAINAVDIPKYRLQKDFKKYLFYFLTNIDNQMFSQPFFNSFSNIKF